jgi:hypothetical protein
MDDKIIQIMRMKGPVIPSDINKQLGLDTLFTGAHLSQMVDTKKLKVTHVKRGGSPFYYLPEQETQLQELSKYLNGREKEAFDLLKQKKVLRDTNLEPIMTVCLRNIKDFATPINVTTNGNTELFWKYYLTSDDEVRQIISSMLAPVEEKKPVNQKQKTLEIRKTVEPRKIEHPKIEVKKEEPRMQKQKDEVQEKIVKKEKIIVKKQEIDQELINKVKEMVKKEMMQAQQQTIKKEEVVVKDPEKETDEFFKQIKKFLDDKKIQITEYEITKKNSEIDFVVKVPSAIGSTNLFCRAKNKKKFNDGDISSAYIKGQTKKLQTFFIGPGDLTKKASEMLEKEFKNQLTFQKI